MQYRKLTELKKLDNNPRTIKKQDMDKLVESIKNNQDYFEARPLILSNRTGELVILGGNQRYEAAKKLAEWGLV
jgi:ParB-like chromosome segregation protein Spo0J